MDHNFNNNVNGSIQAPVPPVPPIKEVEEKYIVNNKIYNLTKAEKVFSFETSEPSKTKIGAYHIPITIKNNIYQSRKENFFIVRDYGKKINIEDLSEERLKKLLIDWQKLELLEKMFPNTFEELEEV